MKTSQALAAAAALCGFAAAKEMAPNPERSAQLYQSGLMHHKIMMHKEVSRTRDIFSRFNITHAWH